MTIFKLIPFWIFILLFHFGGNVNFTYLPILGDKLTTVSIAGLIVSLISFIQLCLDVPAGFILDRFGYVKMLKIGTCIFIVSCLSLAFSTGITGFIITSIISGLGWLFLMPGSNAYVLSIAPKELAEKFISVREIFTAAGICLGSITISYTVDFSPLKVGLISTFSLILALIFISFAPKDKVSVHQEQKIIRHHYYIRRNIFRKLFIAIKKLNPASTILLLQSFCASFFYGVIWFIVPIMMTDPSKKIFGMSLGIFDFSILLTGFFFGKFFQGIKAKKLIILGLLLFSVSGLIIGQQVQWLFLFFGFIASAGDEISNITLWSWMTKLDNNHETDGEVSGTISFFTDIGWSLGPVIAGLLFGIFGGENTITLSAIPILITLIASTFLVSKNMVS